MTQMDISMVVWLKTKVASCVSQNSVTKGLSDFGVLVCVYLPSDCTTAGSQRV